MSNCYAQNPHAAPDRPKRACMPKAAAAALDHILGRCNETIYRPTDGQSISKTWKKTSQQLVHNAPQKHWTVDTGLSKTTTQIEFMRSRQTAWKIIQTKTRTPKIQFKTTLWTWCRIHPLSRMTRSEPACQIQAAAAALDHIFWPVQWDNIKQMMVNVLKTWSNKEVNLCEDQKPDSINHSFEGFETTKTCVIVYSLVTFGGSLFTCLRAWASFWHLRWFIVNIPCV